MKKIFIFSCIIGISYGQKPPTLTPDQIEQIRQAEIPLNNAKATRDAAQAELNARVAYLQLIIDKMGIPKDYMVDEDQQTYKITLKKKPDQQTTTQPTAAPITPAAKPPQKGTDKK